MKRREGWREERRVVVLRSKYSMCDEKEEIDHRGVPSPFGFQQGKKVYTGSHGSGQHAKGHYICRFTWMNGSWSYVSHSVLPNLCTFYTVSH